MKNLFKNVCSAIVLFIIVLLKIPIFLIWKRRFRKENRVYTWKELKDLF